MVLLSFGIDVPESQLRAGCDSTMMGTDALKAVDAMRQLGFANSAKHTLSPDDLRHLISSGQYPIVFISLLPLDQRDDIHAMVIIGITEEAVIALDPLKGERVIPIDTFHLAWESRHYLTILVER